MNTLDLFTVELVTFVNNHLPGTAVYHSGISRIVDKYHRRTDICGRCGSSEGRLHHNGMAYHYMPHNYHIRCEQCQEEDISRAEEMWEDLYEDIKAGIKWSDKNNNFLT